jgi:uncharacterized membrane protein (UPF0127 family)
MIVKVKFEKMEIECEVAKTLIKKIIGLSFSSEKRCMLFVFSREGYYPFSMRFMKYSLDFIFINSELRVVDLRERVRKGVVKSNKPFIYAIEAPEGTIKKLGLKVGDSVEIKLP